jgi:hypothetical protein
MKSSYFSLIGGLILGAASWAIVPLVSDRFEPFDSDSGFVVGQFILCVAAFYIGFSVGMRRVFAYIFGIYLASNIYPYFFGSSESRAWASLASITSLALCIFPLMSGIFGKIVHIGKIKYNNRLKQGPQ